MATEITKQDLRKAYNRFWWVAQTASSFDRMQAVGFCYGMSGILKKVYDKKEDLSEAMKRHLVFFNTMATWGGAILGLSIGMEQEKAEGKEIDGELIIGLKTGLMGPFASIGDSINLATFRTLFFSVAASIGMTGNPVAALIPLIYTVLDWLFGLYMTNLGYNLGMKSITAMLNSGVIHKVIKAAGILGVFMVGALTAKNASIALAPTFVIGGADTSLQSILDGICPGLIQALAVWGCFFF
uniref:PTS system mannose/fructose/sorbose family transporter subunit IID n=1 Tax=Enorma sp. TaxID=1920692 RepID=UPI003AB402A6